MIQAIYIDATEKQVSSFVLNPGHQLISSLVRTDCKEVSIAAVLNEGDVCLSDPEAFFNGAENSFFLNDHLTPIFGNALIIGTDHVGDLSNAKMDVETAKQKIHFLSRQLPCPRVEVIEEDEELEKLVTVLGY